MMRRIGLVVIAAIGAVIGLTVSHSLRGEKTPLTEAAASANPVTRGCIRAMDDVLPPEDAKSACACVDAEFAARGLSLTDAFGDARAEMSEITRDCAQVYGADLSRLEG